MAGLLPTLVLPAIPPAELDRIPVPVTLIWGRRDLQVPLPVAGAAAARRLPGRARHPCHHGEGRAMTAATTELNGHAGPVAAPADALEELAARVGGRLLRPGDPGWDEAVLLWNGAAVRFARDHGVAQGVKGGGHNIAGPPSPRAA
jgi:hypothetical protein